MLDVTGVRQDFAILKRAVHGKPLVYLDNAATTQKPRQVLDAMRRYYEHTNANVHRGIHLLAEEATAAYEQVRARTAKFLNAPSSRSIIFTRNATESINLLAQAWARRTLKPGDRILLTEMEHHSNLVPWQLAAKETGAELVFLPITNEGRLDLSDLDRKLERVKLVSVTHMSNVLGTVNPVKQIIARAKAAGARTVIDGAQSVPHLTVDVQALDCDALAFSAHKMLGPTGVGVLYAREEWLEAMEPFLGGGEMISDVQLTSAKWNEIPWKFEAGTPNIGGVVAFGEALAYLERVGMAAIAEHEHSLAAYVLEKLSALDDITIYGPKTTENRGAVVSFNLDALHPHDVGTVLDSEGVAIRAGHHCAKPLMRRLGVAATARISCYLYNTTADIDRCLAALDTARSFFGRTRAVVP